MTLNLILRQRWSPVNCNEAGRDLIQKFEGLRLRSYHDIGGIRTIGFGHVQKWNDLRESITLDTATALFLADLGTTERALTRELGETLTPNQFSACCSLMFNIGERAFFGSRLFRLLKGGDMEGAAFEFHKWCHVHGVVISGLERRRAAEKELFLTKNTTDHGGRGHPDP